jgi:glycosyltransferase involved in cell wall biosynthesis
MKIEIISFTGDSGLADYSVSLARALTAYAQVTVVTAQSLPSYFDGMGFSIERVFRRSRNFPIDIFRCLKGLLQRKPDWVIFQGPLKFAGFDALVVYVLRLAGIRCAITVHDVLPHYPKTWSQAEFGFYYRAFNKVIAHSQAAELALQSMGITAPILVVPHGVYDIFNVHGLTKEAARSKFNQITSNEVVVLFFGNLESRKGLWELISVAESLSNTESTAAQGAFKFLIAGSPSLSKSGQGAELRLAQAKQLSNVLIHDYRIEFADVEHYFAAADIVALPYLEGTTSGVLKLAIAFGCPVVATHVGDFPEQVPPGGGIILHSRFTADDLKNALISMRQNLQQYTQVMQQSNTGAQWPLIAKQVTDYLKAIV